MYQMSDHMSALYQLITESIDIDPEYESRRQALVRTRLTILDELEENCGAEYRGLLELYGALDGETEELRRQAIFQSALRLGMELGRVQPA